MSSVEHRGALGVVGDAVTAGPASTRWAPRPRGASWPAKARITPTWSFSRSQRDTWTISGRRRRARGPRRRMSAPRSTAPASRRRGGTRTPSRRAGPPRARPDEDRVVTSSARALVLRREGVDRGPDDHARPRGEPAARRRRARRRVGARAPTGAGDPRPATRGSGGPRCRCGSATPRWRRGGAGRAPARRSAGRAAPRRRRAGPAPPARARCRAARARTTPRSRAPSGPPSPSAPCRWLWIRFVTAKNAGDPPITIQRASIPASRARPTCVESISATPPPWAVELTFQTTRARSAPAAASIRIRQPSNASSSTTSRKRSSGCDRDPDLRRARAGGGGHGA